jgi:mRNA-degrading endonuclease toxin of MazEF toxin-antitoxin module
MNRGDVVEVDWYFTDGTGFKRRPAVVVQPDLFNGLIDDTILVQITTTRHGIPNTEVHLDPAVETSSGLTKMCVASCLNVTTYAQDRGHRIVGVISDAAMRQIEGCLKTAMGIP